MLRAVQCDRSTSEMALRYALAMQSFKHAGIVFLASMAFWFLLARPAASTSLAFFENLPAEYDYGLQSILPAGFGVGEFTFEVWIRPDPSFPVGSTAGGTDQLMNWSDADEEPYSSCCWWFAGNFLLDGHNNAGGFENGTFSLQFYGGGRVRWLFGDGAVAGPGGHWSVGAFPATNTASLLDGEWHRVATVRRWIGDDDALLELWVDGSLIATETSSVRTDMRQWWDGWSSFPSGQEGWFWTAEKQAAIGVLSQYEDFKGEVDEIRFFDRDLTPQELDEGGCATSAGLVGYFALDDGAGTSTCDALDPTECITLIDMKPGFWSAESAPSCGQIFVDGFESGDVIGWSLAVP